MSEMMPKLFYKYRSLSSKENLTRIVEQLQEKYLFCPTRTQLNDPFEGKLRNLNTDGGFAGMWYYQQNDLEFPCYAESEENKYRILSLSSTCFSPLMWAHYGDECRGLCLCYRSDRNLKNAKPVDYSEDETIFAEENALKPHDEGICEALFRKHSEWCYEHEWRIVEKTDNARFDTGNDLVAVILGHKMDPKDLSIIRAFIPSSILLLTTHIGGQTRKISLLRDSDSLSEDGTPVEFIRNTEDLYNLVFCNDN